MSSIDNRNEDEIDELLYSNPEDIGSEDEDDITQDSLTFNQAVIWGTDWTAETIDNQLKRSNIDLFPNFQRRDAWSNKAKSKFIESLILGLPIPQIILAEKQTSRGKYIVIDGKQRLLTIRRFFSEKQDDNFQPLRLIGLDILTHLNGKTYKTMKNSVEFADEISQLENQSIRTTIIKNWPNESFLYTVFLRLNTGSIKLNPQELRQALHPGPFIDFADEFSITSEGIQKMLNLKKPDYRMRDVEMVIRFFSTKYYLSKYEGNLKKAFDETVKNLNDSWARNENKIKNDANNLDRAILFTIDLFGGVRHAFSKWNGKTFQNNFNRAIFDIMVYYFSSPEVLEKANEKKEEIINEFKHLCESDNSFLASFEHTTKSMDNTFKRLTTWGEALAKHIDIPVLVPYYNEGKFVEKQV